jgi:hypothetical protein
VKKDFTFPSVCGMLKERKQKELFYDPGKSVQSVENLALPAREL